MSEYPQAIWFEHPRARKEHECCECRGKITIGESYEKVRGIWDGEPSSFKTCTDCAAIRKEVDKGRSNDELSCFTGLYEDIFEGRDVDLIRRYLSNRKERGADIPTWMWERLDWLSKPDSFTSAAPHSGTVVMTQREAS